MSPNRFSSLVLAGLLAAVGCGKSRSTPSDVAGTTTFVGGGADGQDVTVEDRWCVRCHGDAARTRQASDAPGVAFAPPVDPAGATTGAKVGAHLKHLQAGAIRAGVDCGTCHYIPADASSHKPGVHLRGTATAQSASASYASGTCSATYCHGNFTGGAGPTDVTWTGAALTCGVSCHATPPANGAHTGVAANDWAKCAGCHGNTVDASGNIKIAGGLHVNGKVDGGCTSCHGTNGRPDGGIAGVSYDANQASAPPAETALHSTSTVLVGAHLAHVNPTPSVGGATPTGGVYKPIACTECHPDNTTGSHPDNAQAQVTFSLATGAVQNTFPVAFTQGDGLTTPTNCSTYCHNGAPDASATRPTWTGAAATCGSCHGFPPASGIHGSVAADATKCSTCHPGTVKVDGSIDIAGGLHIDGTVEASAEPSVGGTACSTCHSAIFNAMNGTVVKPSRHALTSDDPAFQTTINWGDPLSNNAVGVRSCTNMCHDDHPHTAGGASDHSYNTYVDANARATAASTTTRSNTDFDSGTNAGLCVSCHQFASAGTVAIAGTAFGASAHDFTSFTSGSTWTWQYALHAGSYARNCTKCHASGAEGRTPTAPAVNSGTAAVHFSDNATLLAGTTSPIGAGNVCYNCHGSAAPVDGAQGNRSGKNIQAQFAKASNHAVAGSCTACHDPHQAKAGTHVTPGNLAGPPLQGASGAAFTGTVGFWTAPAAGDFTARAIVAGTDVEATLCFKCHSAFGGATDVAKEFNPGNTGNFAGTWASGETAGGFHPVLASAGNNLGAIRLANLVTTNQTWSTTTRNTMTCTDCHESNAVADPNGPHGSTANFILKGPNTTWSASVILGSSIPAGTFCLNCHQSTFGNSRFGGHSVGEHDVIPCFNCHAAVPHGGPRPGMVIGGPATDSLAAVGGRITGWDGVAPYWQGTGSNQLFLKSYPASNAAGINWTAANCGCGAPTGGTGPH